MTYIMRDSRIVVMVRDIGFQKLLIAYENYSPKGILAFTSVEKAVDFDVS